MGDTWTVQETTFNPAQHHAQETVFTIGNGYLSTRGAFEEGYPDEWAVTLVHGVFDDAPVVATELANIPNWLPLAVSIEGERVRLDQGEIVAYRRVLNLADGVLTRSFRWRSPAGRIVDVRYERLTSLADQHLLGIRCHIEAVNFSGMVEVEAALDGHVTNQGVEHWNKMAQGQYGERIVYLQSITRGTAIMLCQAACLDVKALSEVSYTTRQPEGAPSVCARFELHAGQAATVQKMVTVFTSREVGLVVQQAALGRLEVICDLPDAFDRARAESSQAWARRWEVCDIEIEGDDEAQLATRYSLFQLLIAAPDRDEYVSIAAKTMSGFGYRGHVFWDTEIFILPFFTYTLPHIARNLLRYRYHTLGGARRKARENGYLGAQYPWESAATGEEVTPRYVPGPAGKDVRIWTGDIEIHISSDIAYAILQYWQVTGDDSFMVHYGAEMILETALFLGSRVEWVAEHDRYEITDIIGPDEYHERVDNNVYTNYLTRWHLSQALDLVTWLERYAPAKAVELTERLALRAHMPHWQEVIDKIYLPYTRQTRLYEQFEGYFEREDVDLAALEPRDKSVQALLGIERTNQTQVIKQPDVLMLMYLLPDEFESQTIQANWDYYTPRTDLTHGSSLAPGIQAALSCRMGDADAAYPFFRQAALIDLNDLRLNTEHGIHGAAAGSVWQAIALGFAGVRLVDSGLATNPRLPSSWRSLKFRLTYRGHTRLFEFHRSEDPLDLQEETV